MCYFMYVGHLNEAMKIGFPYVILRGVPFEASGMFTDLFLSDPLYVQVDESEAKEMLSKLESAGDDRAADLAFQQANVESVEQKRKDNLANWYANRDAARTVVAKPMPVFPAPAEAPPRVIPQKKGGGSK